MAPSRRKIHVSKNSSPGGMIKGSFSLGNRSLVKLVAKLLAWMQLSIVLHRRSIVNCTVRRNSRREIDHASKGLATADFRCRRIRTRQLQRRHGHAAWRRNCGTRQWFHFRFEASQDTIRDLANTVRGMDVRSTTQTVEDLTCGVALLANNYEYCRRARRMLTLLVVD